jgi:hypothetical protein
VTVRLGPATRVHFLPDAMKNACYVCNGQGHVWLPCQVCNGKGNRDCIGCSGMGRVWVTCQRCGGSGYS